MTLTCAHSHTTEVKTRHIPSLAKMIVHDTYTYEEIKKKNKYMHCLLVRSASATVAYAIMVLCTLPMLLKNKRESDKWDIAKQSAACA